MTHERVFLICRKKCLFTCHASLPLSMTRQRVFVMACYEKVAGTCHAERSEAWHIGAAFSWLDSCTVDESVEHVDEFLVLIGLDDVAVGADLHGALLVLGCRAGCENHERQRAVLILGADGRHQ